MTALTKEIFVLAIKSLENQFITDKLNGELMQTVFNTEDCGIYDNEVLVKTILGLLRLRFPKIDGSCEIEHFCFELNSGVYIEEKSISQRDLWN
jgi:hypothetical protein